MAASVPDTTNGSAFLDATRYAAVVGRDAACDGQFFYGVRTTGVVCKPSCPARTPRPENVVFFTAVTDALAAGFRPCKRCQPERLDGASPQAELHAAVVTEVCRTIDQAISAGNPAPTLAALATRTGFS
ncbi:MAG: Ada metal-binding domain-containing protein, partial [Gemmatimonadaceae bacterium]